MTSDILLKRTIFTDKSTIGNFTFGDFSCFSLEDTVRKDGIKIYGKTAIPIGQYEIIINDSVRFGRPMPLLLSVPEFEGVRIHPGNTDKDTEGCILIGNHFDPGTPDYIGQSQLAFETFFPKLEDLLKTQKVYISVT